MSTLVFLNAVDHSLIRRRRASRGKNGSVRECIRGNLDTTDPRTQLRIQRILFQKELRRSKRDQILEDRRHVMQKINWTTAFDDDDSEEELESLTLSWEDYLSEIARLATSAHVTRSHSHELVDCLNWLRRLLDREMKSKFGPVDTIMGSEPGPIAIRILSPEVLPLFFHLLESSLCTPRSVTDIDICRNVSSILKSVTRFSQFREAFSRMKTFSGADLLAMSVRLLSDLGSRMDDLVCHSNAFAILSNLLSEDQDRGSGRNSPTSHRSLASDPNFITVMTAQVSHHLSNAASLYEPEDPVVAAYISNITSFMTTFLNFLLQTNDGRKRRNSFMQQITASQFHHQHDSSSHKSITSFMTCSLEQLTQLVVLNDPTVTQNVLEFVKSIVVMSPVGASFILSNSSSLVPFLLDTWIKKAPHHQLALDIIACLAASSTSSMSPSPLFIIHFLANEVFLSHLSLSNEMSHSLAVILRCLSMAGGREVCHLLISRFEVRDFIENYFFYGERKTEEEIIGLLEGLSSNCPEELLPTLFDEAIVGNLNSILSQKSQSLERTRDILEILFKIISRLRSPERNVFVKKTGPILYPTLDYIYNNCANREVSARAADLLDFYTDISSQDES